MTYEGAIFAKLVDNGFSGCSPVVGADARKWGCLGGVSCTVQGQCWARTPTGMWELQLQHCAVLQTDEDAGFDGNKAFVDGGRGELLFGKRFAIRAVQGV